jgi:DNA repair photolyase
MREKQILMHNAKGTALTKQYMKDSYEFPFTLNPTIGCLFGCRYCYLQKYPFNQWAAFGEEVKVKTRLPENLDLELQEYRHLPQYLKRVQVGPACECFHPDVLSRTRRELGRDIMSEILETFERHWNEGNHWMVHLVTKSHLVARYLDILERMRPMVQVEITLVCLSESTRRKYERYAPSVDRRLRAIRQLSEAGIFVRVMAMPLLCPRGEALDLQQLTFNHGARGFKNKGLNYFDVEGVLQGVPESKRGRHDTIDTTMLVESGEPLDGETVTVDMPVCEGKRRWLRLEPREMPILRSGYSELNDIDWSYLV